MAAIAFITLASLRPSDADSHIAGSPKDDPSAPRGDTATMDDTGMLYPVDSQTSKKVFLNPECKQYMPEQCALTKEAGPAEKPYCHNGNGISKDCNFDTAFLKDCPLPEKGDHRSIPHPISGTLRTAHFHPIRQLPVP
jgi:hypothetical protein